MAKVLFGRGGEMAMLAQLDFHIGSRWVTGALKKSNVEIQIGEPPLLTEVFHR